MPLARWSSEDQHLRVGGPWGSKPVRNLVTGDPPSWRSGHEGAGSGPLVTSLRAEMVPRGPTSSGTWSPRNHLARCARTPGPQGTRICVWVVPRGSTPQATWSLVHHPRRRSWRPGHEKIRTRAKLVPRGPSSREIWSLVFHLARSWRRKAAGVVPGGTDLAPGWSP